MSVESALLRLPSRPSDLQRFTLTAFAFAGLWLGSVGCENTDVVEEPDAGTGQESTTYVLSDTNSCSARDTLAIPEVETVSGAELSIDWSGFTEDLYRRAVSPAADVDSVVLLRFLDVSQDALKTRLAANDIGASDIEASFGFVTDHAATTVSLSALTDANGAPIDMAQAFIAGAGYTYLLTLATGTTPGVGIRSMTFVRPSAASQNSAVAVAAATGVLTRVFSVGREPLIVPPTGVWTVDWSGLTRDVFGAELPLDGINTLGLAYYEGQSSAAFAQDYFAATGSIPTRKWELALNGGATTASLGMAKEVLADGSAGTYFAGFEGMADGLWLMSLECSTCMNPTPPVMVVIEPTATP